MVELSQNSDNQIMKEKGELIKKKNMKGGEEEVSVIHRRYLGFDFCC